MNIQNCEECGNEIKSGDIIANIPEDFTITSDSLQSLALDERMNIPHIIVCGECYKEYKEFTYSDD